MDNQPQITIVPSMAHNGTRELELALAKSEAQIVSLEQELREMKAQHAKDLEAVSRIKEMLRRHSKPDALPQRHGPDDPYEIIRSGTVREALRATLPLVAKQQTIFGTTELIQYWGTLPEEGRPVFDIQKNRANISRAMGEFLEDGIVQQVEKAAGQRQATYRLVR